MSPSATRFDHVYAILRYESEASDITSIEARITVKKIVLDAFVADAEVKRLNELNRDKGCHYFSQVTRIEKGALEASSVAEFSAQGKSA